MNLTASAGRWCVHNCRRERYALAREAAGHRFTPAAAKAAAAAAKRQPRGNLKQPSIRSTSTHTHNRLGELHFHDNESTLLSSVYLLAGRLTSCIVRVCRLVNCRTAGQQQQQEDARAVHLACVSRIPISSSSSSSSLAMRFLLRPARRKSSARKLLLAGKRLVKR